MKSEPNVTFAVLAAFTLAILLFLLAPTFLVSWASFGAANTLSVPPADMSLHWHVRLLENPGWRTALENSLQIAMLAALIATAAAVAAAMALLNARAGIKAMFFGLFLAPLLFPTVALAVGQLGAFAEFGLPDSVLRLAISHLAICLPVAFLVVSLAIFGPFEKHVRRALAFTDSRSFVLSRIVVPLMGAQLLGAAIIAFLFSFDEPVLSQFVGGPDTDTIPRRIFNGIRYELDPTAAAVTLFVFLAWSATAALLILSDRAFNRGRA